MVNPPPDTREAGPGPLQRAAAIMDHVSATTDGLTVSELCKVLDIPQPSMHRLVRSLCAVGYLEGGGRGAKHRVGARFLRQAHAARPDDTTKNAALPILEPIAELLGETVYLTTLRQRRVELVATALPGDKPGVLVHPGEQFPFHASSSGKAIAAQQTPSFVDSVLAKPLEAFRPATLVDHVAIRAELALVREQGYAIIDDELDAGVWAMSVPVSVDGQFVYAVGVVGLRERVLDRFDPGELAELLQTAAARLSAALALRA